MPKLQFIPTGLQGLYRIVPFFHEDARGTFVKSFVRDGFNAAGIPFTVDECFETISSKGVLRGMHFQTKAPQGKLVRVLSGRIFDVAVDLRAKSPTFGQWEGIYLDSVEHNAVYLPPGFAHGFLVVSSSAHVGYICSGAYLPEYDTGIPWNDPDVGIDWPLHLVGAHTLSARDQAFLSLARRIRTQSLPQED